MVVGGGDSGFQEALTLSEFASKVTIIHRGATSHAQAIYQRRVQENERIAVRESTAVIEVVGDQSVTGVRVRNESTSQEEVLPAAGVWIYAGLEPNTSLLKDKIELDSTGHIPTDPWLRTQLRGVFAAGDIRSNSARQAITAAGDGATAAIAAHHYLSAGTGW